MKIRQQEWKRENERNRYSFFVFSLFSCGFWHVLPSQTFFISAVSCCCCCCCRCWILISWTCSSFSSHPQARPVSNSVFHFHFDLSDRQQTTDSCGIIRIWISINPFISSWLISWCRILIPCPPECTHQLVRSVLVDWQWRHTIAQHWIVLLKLHRRRVQHFVLQFC